MEITENIKKEVNLIINSLAEDRFQDDKRCDTDITGWFWSDCVDYALDDFDKDPQGYLDTHDIVVSKEEANEISQWAFENVNVITINKYMEK